MKRILKLSLSVLFAGLVIILGHIYYLTTLTAKESYPEDTYLLSEPNKTALIIVAHDDDAVGSSGTMTMLCKNNWKIREMCFFQQGGLYLVKDSLKNPVRKKCLEQVARIQGFQGIDPVDFNFRNDMMTEKAYFPMPYEDFPKNYKTDSLISLIAGYIKTYKPAVIFSLDDVIGGYGNPDHVVISQLVVRYCKEHKNDKDFSVKKIYQNVFSPSLAEGIMKNMPVYAEAKKVYKCNGMPLPDVQVNIYPYAKEKKEAMTAYTTEQNSLRQIWPYYNWYPSWLYFKIFDRDFFRVLDVSKL